MAAGAVSSIGLSREAALAEFTEAVSGCAEQALARGSGHELRLAPGGVAVRLRIAGDALAQTLLPALAPLAASADLATAAPAIEIVAFDSAGSGVELPPPPWPADAYRPRDEIEGFGEGDHKVAYGIEYGTLSLVDTARDRAVFWARDAQALPRWETGAPLRTLLRWALRPHGLQLVHGAVVGGADGAVLLAGVGGAGKSTTALACALGGIGFLGDDYCVLDPATPPRAHALYALGKAGPGSVRLLPALATALVAGGPTPEGKELIDVERARPGALERSAPLTAIIVPRVAEQTGAPVAISAAQALVAIAPTTLLQLPGSSPQDLRAMAALARELPAFSLDVGPRVADVAAAVRSVLEATA